MNLPAKIKFQAAALAVLEEVRLALAQCVDVRDAKEIRDRAKAVECYLKQQRESAEAQNQAARIKLFASRRAGELLREMDGKGTHGGNRKSSSTMRLDEMGINKSQSSRWQALASIPEDTFEAFISESVSKGELTEKAAVSLAKKLKKEKVVSVEKTGQVFALADFGEKFRCIYADPPWKYGNQATRASTDNHYPTMTVEEIAALPVSQMVEDKAVLFLWTTNGFLRESFDVIDAWGFEFKSTMVWVKPQMGIGNYVRNAHEFLMIGSRGGMRTDGKSQISWIESRRGKHSKKPQEFRQVIENMAPGPRLELFARETSPGWCVWGNEVESTLFGSR